MIEHQRIWKNQKTVQFLFVVAILICVVLNPLNSSTISVALPALLHALRTTSNGITWIVSGYYLGSSIAQPVMGRLGDVWGRSRFVYAGLCVMIVTAIFAPLSHSLVVFVMWRVIQAVGTSMILPNAIALLRDIRSQDVGRVLGWIGMAGGIAVALGPTIGGVLVDVASWHAIFWLNIPLSLIAIVLLWLVLPKKKTALARMEPGPSNVDFSGIILFTITACCWLLWANSSSHGAVSGTVMLALSVAGTIALVSVEFRKQSPVIPVRWFRYRQFSLISIITILDNVVMYCILYGIPMFLETVRHMSPAMSGVILLAFAGVMSLTSPLGGHYAQGSKRRFPLLLSGVLLTFGTFGLSWISRLPLALLILCLALIGISFALSNVVSQQIVLESVPKSETGQASGVYTLMRYLGTMMSSVLIGSSITSVSGAQHLFIILTVISFASMILTIRLKDARMVIETGGKS